MEQILIKVVDYQANCVQALLEHHWKLYAENPEIIEQASNELREVWLNVAEMTNCAYTMAFYELIANDSGYFTLMKNVLEETL